MKVDIKQLTTCGVRPDGTAVELNFIDGAGTPATLSLPFDHAQSLAMTLPRLLTEALRSISSDEMARYVFPLAHWRIETATDQDCLIATFATEGGFEVSFGIPREACRGLGWALGDEARNIETPDSAAHEPLGPLRVN